MRETFESTAIYNRVEKLRLEKKWTIYELAKHANISVNSLYRWRDKKSSPSLYLLENLAEAFQVSLLYLLFDIERVDFLTVEHRMVLDKWNRFTEDLKKYNCEQDYFEKYNSVKEAAMAAIKNSEAFKFFNEDDMNKYVIKHTGLPSGEIYHPGNDGKMFISVDMRQANFSSLSYYADRTGKSIFNGASTWEDFISLFAESSHIIHSKYIRQVILGNCNPRQ